MSAVMKRLICILLLLSLTLSLCSCGKAKQKEMLRGAILSADIPIAEESAAPEEIIIVGGTEDHTPMGWNEELTSANGEVKVSIHDDAFDGVPDTMPVIAVQPQMVTSDMVKQAAAAIFGDAIFYEDGSWELTRAEIEERIAAWEKGVTAEVIHEDYGENLSEEQYERLRRIRQDILDYYREAWAYAPEEITPRECDWLFRPAEYWIEQSHDFSIEYPTYSDDTPFGVWSSLIAETEADGITYRIWASNLTRDGFWNHSIYVDPVQSDGQAYYEVIPATDEELRQAEQDAEQLLLRMGFGNWRCEAKNVELLDQEDTPLGLYYIAVSGAKVRNGWVSPVWSQYSQYGGGYPEYVYLERTKNGTLLNFKLQGLLEDGASETVPLISTDEAMDAAREAMRGWTLDDRRLGIADDHPTLVTRTITGVKVGYCRVPTGEWTYELVPALTFLGTEESDGLFADPQEGTLVFDLLVIDLRDGSVIDTRTERN